MPQIKTIELPSPFRLGRVNCYLVTTDTGSVLIDTGASNQQAALEQARTRAGCAAGNIQLIVLTHGDFDHTGDAAYLAAKFGMPFAMHQADAGLASPSPRTPSWPATPPTPQFLKSYQQSS